MIPPPNQSQRSIGFYLLGSPAGDATFEFGLRPEEVSYQEPSRLQVNQTLGGAWADAFDRGVSSISLSGTTGWRGSAFQSGEDLHQGLRSTVFAGWHDGRRAAVEQGVDPSTVELYYVDALNSISALVAPRSFSMRRSRSSPLLMRYQIQLLVLDDASGGDDIFDSIIAAFTNPLRWLLAVTGLQNAIALIQRYVGLARAAFGAAFAIVDEFVGTGIGLINAVVGAATETVGLFGAVENAILGTAVEFCFAAANGFAVLCVDATLLASEIVPIQALSNAFADAACAMSNGFDLIGLIPDFRALRGASHCSSTGGGDPASLFTVQDVNPFGYITPAAIPPVTVTSQAQAGLTGLQGDPLRMVGQPDLIYGQMADVGQGVDVS